MINCSFKPGDLVVMTRFYCSRVCGRSVASEKKLRDRPGLVVRVSENTITIWWFNRKNVSPWSRGYDYIGDSYLELIS